MTQDSASKVGREDFVRERDHPASSGSGGDGRERRASVGTAVVVVSVGTSRPPPSASACAGGARGISARHFIAKSIRSNKSLSRRQRRQKKKGGGGGGDQGAAGGRIWSVGAGFAQGDGAGSRGLTRSGRRREEGEASREEPCVGETGEGRDQGPSVGTNFFSLVLRRPRHTVMDDG
jgi:hypothetical protein